MLSKLSFDAWSLDSRGAQHLEVFHCCVSCFQHKLEQSTMESSFDQVRQRRPAPISLEQRDGNITAMEQIICSCSGALVTSFLSKFYTILLELIHCNLTSGFP